MMLSVFRKIRLRLLRLDATKRYVVYAIGEIALVVIGILIALQVNNWNEQRKDLRMVRVITTNLISEFESNRLTLQARMNTLASSISHSRKILSMIGSYDSELEEREIDSILSYTTYYGNFNPSNAAIEELIHSGKLDLVEDDTLKQYLFQWLQLLEDTSEDFKNQDLKTNEYLVPFLSRHVSLRNLLWLENYKVNEDRSVIRHEDYASLFQNLEFENLMTENTLWHTIMLDHFKSLDDLALRILERIHQKR
jgi:hypothetical protein